MIRTKNPSSEFMFLNNSGLKTIAPVNTRIYVNLSDNGRGYVEVNGRIDRQTHAAEPATESTQEIPASYEEIGWVRVPNGKIAANDADLLNKAHLLVIESLASMNEVEFEIYY